MKNEEQLSLEELAAIMASIELFKSDEAEVTEIPHPSFSPWQASAMEFYKQQRVAHSLTFKRS